MSKIGIAITTHNRNDVALETLKQIKKFAPKGSKIVVVDDFSTVPFPNADYRFEYNAGIAVAKNKCLELLEDCEHIFLFDDDCYPIHKDWANKYIECGIKHLMYTFLDFSDKATLNDNSILHKNDKYIAYSHPRGCMLYLHNSVLKTVGGMRSEFGKWGYEHPEYSDRIFNVGLTPFKYLDIVDSNKYIHSLDEHRAVTTTVKGFERLKCIESNKPLLETFKDSTDFVPYKEEFHDIKGENVILTSYFKSIDPQTGKQSEFNLEGFKSLKNSFKNVILLESDSIGNPYFYRWLVYYEYILNNPQIGSVFLVDATDVEMLNNPFGKINKDKLYVGDEPGTLNNVWLFRHHRSVLMQSFLTKNAKEQIYNAGVIGGSREKVLEFLKKIVSLIHSHDIAKDMTDMAIFNYTLYKYFRNDIVSGRRVVTEFKKNERNNYSWFKHK